MLQTTFHSSIKRDSMIHKIIHGRPEGIRKYFILLMLLMAAGSGLMAQCPGSAATPFDPSRGGVNTNSGAFITSQPGSLWAQDGGLDNSDGGTLQISGDVYINGDLRLSNNTSIVINTGGRLFVYGNVYINSGSTLTVNSGGNFYFYGEEWINEAGAIVDNAGGAGTVSFIMPRPAPGTIDPVSGSARYPDNATAYTSTANATQYLDGGGVVMNANIAQYNPNNISLCNLDNSAGAGSGDTHLGGTLSFSVNEGDIVLNDNNFILTATGNYTHNTINAYDGYFVTSGTGGITKEGLADGASFTFPIGQAENDYTPAVITNTSGAVNSYYAQVATYATSGSTESVPAEGVDRTWQIYSGSGGTANICLQHNSVTNAAGAGTDGSSFDNAMGFATQQTGSGIWSTGTQAAGGSPVSSHCGSYTIVTSSSEAGSYFSKSSDVLSPLPVTLSKFEGIAVNCIARLNWKTASESNSSRYVIEYSTNGVDFVAVAEVASHNKANGAAYEYNYDAVSFTTSYFRLKMVDKDNRFEHSRVISVSFNCAGNILIAPNPVKDVLTIRGLNAGHEVMITNAGGQQMIRVRPSGGVMHMDTKEWTKGLYIIRVMENGRMVKTKKVLKQ